MKTTNRLILIVLLMALSYSTNTLAQTLSWAQNFGSSTGGDVAYSVVTDAAGNSYTAGTFTGTVDFDPGSGVHNITGVGLMTSILKLDPAGNFLWVKVITPAGSFGDAIPTDIEIDPSGNIYVLGRFTLTACDFDPGPAVFSLTPIGSSDGFLLKLNPNGNFSWVKTFGGTSAEFPSSLTLDGSGNIFVSGSYYDTADFDPGAGVSNLTSAGGFDIFILKLNSLGDFVWVKSIGGTETDEGSTIYINGSGEVYVFGRFQETADFDPGPGIFNLTAAGSDDIYILKLDVSGNFLWAKRIGGSGSDIVKNMKVDPSGNFVISGFFNETVDFDPGAGITNVTSVGGSDGYILKLDASGNFIWVKTIGGIESDAVNGLLIDAFGSIYLSGTFRVVCDFDPGAGVYNLTSTGDTDIFVAKLNGSGLFQWTRSIGGTSVDNDRGIGTDIAGNIFIVGGFQGTSDFNPDTGVFNLTSNGGYDQFVLKLLRDCVPSSSIIMISNCTSYTVPSGHETYTTSGTYTDTIPNAAGCDSVITINLTIGDGIAPVANVASLANVTSQCSVTSLTAPTATDNCAGTITGTHNATLPITISGTTVVTWTYNDGNGNTSTQTQNVIISDNTAPVANTATLADVTGQCSVTSLTAPTATDNCAGTITGTHNATLPITTQGTTVVTWTYNDGNGNTSTQTQNVIIADNIAPVANVASLANVTGQCSVTSLTAPTATDNCSGTITGTHNATLPITTSGTTVVTWTYDDGHGNSSTQTQNVIITDDIAPVANTATLADVTGQCSVTSLTAPTATDNCAGTITGIHNATLPITTSGTTVVTWTYNDGHGNSSTQTQNVIVTVPVATTTLNGITISATTSGASYQWINCGNGNVPITGATSQSFTATANGTYAVIVTQNGCSSTSSCVTISTVGLEELEQTIFTVYPNPNNGTFTVVTQLQTTINMTNTAGQLILTQQLEIGETTIELTGIESGMYFITGMDSKDKISVQRVNVIR